MRPKIEEHIAEKISSFEEGMIFFIDDFLDFGSSESVKKALYRLETKDKIKRLSHGIYYKPKFSKIVGELLPSVEDYTYRCLCREYSWIDYPSADEISLSYRWSFTSSQN